MNLQYLYLGVVKDQNIYKLSIDLIKIIDNEKNQSKIYISVLKK